MANENELKASIEALEKEKSISADVLFDAIENALMSACRNQYGRVDNIHVDINRDTFKFRVYADKTVVENPEDVEDKTTQISLEDAKQITPDAEVGAQIQIPINSMNLGRIATMTAKNVITQRIREEERNAIFEEYSKLQHHVVTGQVQRKFEHRAAAGQFQSRTDDNGSFSYSINLGHAEGLLPPNEQVPGEYLQVGDRIKVYIVEVRANQKDSRSSGAPRILVSRTHPELVKCLFEEEVAEIRDGIVEIRSIAREAGSRTKMAVWSNNPNVDPVGACVGINGSRVSRIVDELHGEKIDIVNWDENPGNLIQNALSPAKIVAVFADPDERTAKVVVPDYQLSLAIGSGGQNARLAAKLTNYKIDIKSETQAKDAPGFRYEDYVDTEEVEYVDENGNPVDAEGNPLPADEEEAGDFAEAEDSAEEENGAEAEENETAADESSDEEPSGEEPSGEESAD